MAMAIETSIVRYIGTGAEVAEGALTKLKPPLGSTFYASDVNARYIYDGTRWSPLTPEAAAGAEHQVQLLIAILAELKALRSPTGRP
jgi:hypothetical protein